MKKIKINDLMVHRTTDEIIHITDVKESEEFPGVIWVSFVNNVCVITFKKDTFSFPCCTRFPLHTERMIRDEFVKFGEF